MKRFVRTLAVTLGLIVLGSIVFLVPQKNATATSGAPVTVMNTVTNPVPVAGNVNATVSGNVGVNNFPTTQNVSFNGSAQPVTFSNTSLDPVFVDTNAPARSAVSGRCATRSDAIGFASCDLVDVPSGKILVLDTVSAQILVPTGKAVFNVLVIVEANDVSGVAREVEYRLPVSLIGSPAFGNIHAFAGPLTLYAIGNNSVFAEVFTDDTSQSSEIFFSFSGHLVTP